MSADDPNPQHPPPRREPRVRVCYCSLYDDCRVSDSRADEPAAAQRCALDPALEFES